VKSAIREEAGEGLPKRRGELSVCEGAFGG